MPAGIVSDLAPAPGPNASLAKAITFAYNTDAIDPAKPAVASASDITTSVGGDNDVVTVQFSKPVEKATALNVSNYLVDGVAVFEKAVFDTDNTKVKLTLKDGALKDSGDHLVTVKNVKDLAGTAMNTVNYVKPFVENVNPTLVSAELTADDTITLTFSENITKTVIEEGTAAADFAVFVGGVDVTSTAFNGGYTVTEAGVGAGTEMKVFTLTLSTPLTDVEAAKAITIKKAAGFDVVDMSGNALAISTVTVAK